MFFERYREYAPAFVRYGVSIVFLLFGFSQIFNPGNWLAWLPIWIGGFGIELESLVIFLGVFNLIVGAGLMVGYKVRFFAVLVILHLAGVIISLGYNDISIRDFGLLLASIAVFLHGRDGLCLGGKGK